MAGGATVTRPTRIAADKRPVSGTQNTTRCRALTSRSSGALKSRTARAHARPPTRFSIARTRSGRSDMFRLRVTDSPYGHSSVRGLDRQGRPVSAARSLPGLFVLRRFHQGSGSVQVVLHNLGKCGGKLMRVRLARRAAGYERRTCHLGRCGEEPGYCRGRQPPATHRGNGSDGKAVALA